MLYPKSITLFCQMHVKLVCLQFSLVLMVSTKDQLFWIFSIVSYQKSITG